ncbi:hypothetical protein IV500_18185 [Paeniglutamicibacter antarcticus]|uniref:Uncharacterized protein n=1 Tax=Arthrobacter terrae TaxID=2935737 RepID=A0A931G6Q3_9MICC|nr:hypothetical protein [Arthrobacter terrae]
MCSPGTTDFFETYTERLANCFGIDHGASAVLIALFTHQIWGKGMSKPFAAMVQGLRRQFSAAGLLVHCIWIVGPTSFAPYDGADPTLCGKETPLAALHPQHRTDLPRQPHRTE